MSTTHPDPPLSAARDRRAATARTAEGCPMEDVLRRGIAGAARSVAVETELVWEPRWHPGMIREGA